MDTMAQSPKEFSNNYDELAEQPVMHFRQIAGSLRPTTSKITGRYYRTDTVTPEHQQISPGMFTLSREPLPTYLPPQWSTHIHPEGQRYFYKHSALHVITEAYLYRSDIMEKVDYWSEMIKHLLLEKKMTITDDVELFLEIDDNDCAYYFVDHHTHIEFWLDDTDTEELNMSPAVSPPHLRLALHELYWNHVEHFPMHLKGVPRPILDELIGVLSHALADHMTSRSSTFPYTAPQCKKFLGLLRSSQDQLHDGNTTCLVARLWHLIFNHRFSTHYGEEHSRLSRSQAILVDSARESRPVAFMTSLLSFRTSEVYLSHLNDIYTDRLVYVHQWQPFMSKCLKDWRGVSYMALLSLILHVFFVFVPPSMFLMLVSALCLGSSLISSALLVHRHETLEDATAGEAYLYLNTIRSDRFKFQLVAFAYSLPKAMYFWGLTALFLNWVIIIARHIGPGIAVGLFGIFLLALWVFQRTTSHGEALCDYEFLDIFKSKELPEASPV